MRKLLLLGSLVLLILTSSASAKWIDDAMREPIGVRAAGLGGAFTGIADDSSAIFYNPAGLAEPGSQFQSGMMDNNQSRLNLSAYSVMNLGPLAYGEHRLASHDNEFANIYSYAFAFRGMDGINWGLTYKRVMEESGDRNSDQGWAADLGLLFKLTPEANVGILAQNITVGGELPVVPNYRVGGSVRYWDILWAVDAEYQDMATYRTPNTAMHYGLEKEIIKGFALRLGSDDNAGTFGFSLGLPFMVFEYANWATIPYTYRFGFKLGYDKNQPEKDRSFALFKEKDFVEITIGGDMVAGQSTYSFFGGDKPGADVIREQVRLARKDPQIGGTILYIGTLDSNLGMFGTIQEIRQELTSFKAEGKKVIAYIAADADYSSYYLASVADKIIMPPAGSLGLFGVMVQPWYLGKLLDNFGIQFKTIYAGTYKTGTNPMGELMPTASRELLVTYIQDVNEQVLAEIQKSRKLTPQTVSELRTGKVFTAKKAKDMQLIDALGHYEDAKDMIKDVAGTDAEPDVIKATAFSYNDQYFRPVYFWPTPHRVAVIDVDGELIIGHSQQDMMFGNKVIGADDVCEQLEKAGKDWMVKVIVLRINSPGGAAIAADQIYAKILQVKDKYKKVVVASCGNVAASGGYYIACAADRIIANPATILGSIGVFNQFPVYYRLLKNIEVKAETLKTGDSTDMLTGLRDLSPTETAMLQDAVNDIHEQFIMIVAKGRKVQLEKVRPLAQGQIFTGIQSKKNGLIDELGNFSTALDVACELGEIEGDPEVVHYVRTENIFGQLGYRASTMLGLDKQLAFYFQKPLMQYKFPLQ